MSKASLSMSSSTLFGKIASACYALVRITFQNLFSRTPCSYRCIRRSAAVRRKMYLTRNSCSCNETGHELMSPSFIFP